MKSRVLIFVKTVKQKKNNSVYLEKENTIFVTEINGIRNFLRYTVHPDLKDLNYLDVKYRL